jgi:succinyl-CoA synthetase beta subunit
MELYEFQAKQLLNRYGVATPEGRVAVTPDEVEQAVQAFGGRRVFLKAQIHAGDRAKAGGVRPVDSAAAARNTSGELLGRKLVTQQTGPDGHLVKRVLVEEAVDGGQEFYLAAMVEPLSGSIMFLGGAGGTDIEERAAKGAAALERLNLAIKGEAKPGDIADFCKRMGLKDHAAKLTNIIVAIHKAFVELDASLIEINPLVLTKDGNFIALDAKIILDDNAMFRHPELAELRETDEIDEVELKAQRSQINFVRLDGDIGVVVNGAGLGLVTLDLLHAAGGKPANFMDIRTTAKSLDIANGIGLVLDNPKVKVLFVNVFGGGMQPCDTIIEGLGIALRRKGRVLPVVLRVTGNNEDVAKARVESFGLPKIYSTDMWQAAQRAVAVAQGKA